MGASGQNNEDQPLYQHQLEAILRRVKFEDLAAIGALWRVGYRKPKEVEASTRSVRKRSGAGAVRVVDFNVPSPLTGRDRQGGGRRVPHVSIKPIQATGPRIKGERLPEGEGRKRQSGSQHIDYLAAGAKITIGSHLDYLRRQFESHDPGGDLYVDMLDEQVMRAEQNRLAYHSNIPGGIERHKSLFDAAERCEPKPTRYHLKADTAALAALEDLVEATGGSFPVQRMVDQLRAERAKRKALVAAKGLRFKEFRATVASGSRREVSDWLKELDDHPQLKGRVSCKPGRAGRVQFRMVFELPVGLSAVERHAVMRDFCDELGADGHMFVAAIHQPDRTNDKRNYHIHVDFYDRPAKWLDEHACWDFEYKVRKNGKDTYPLRQNKVRYSEPPAPLFRERYIRIVERVRDGRKDIAEFLEGTYKDNDIDLTPLDHMGPRAIGLEKRGVVTAVGIENARRIWSDEFRHAEKLAWSEYWKETGPVLQVFGSAKRDGYASDAWKSFIDLRKKIFDRRLQAELARITVGMMRSRADAVIRTLTPEPGRLVVPQKGDVALLKQARAHVAWIESHAPSEDMIAVERQALKDLEKAAAEAKARVLAACSEPTAGQSVAVQHVNEPDVPAAGRKQRKPSQFDELKRQRLHSWLDKHIEDPACLRRESSAFLRGERMPKAIYTLMAQFAHEPEFKNRLRAEHARRSSLPSPTIGVEERPVSEARPTSLSVDSSPPAKSTMSEPGEAPSISTSTKSQADDQIGRGPSDTVDPTKAREDHNSSARTPEPSSTHKADGAKQQVPMPTPRSPTAAELAIMRGKLPKVRVKPLTEPIEANHRNETDDQNDRTEHGTPAAAQFTWDADSFRRNADRARSVGTIGGLHGLRTLGMAGRQVEAASTVPKNRDVDVRRRTGAEGDSLRTAPGKVGAKGLNADLHTRKAVRPNPGVPIRPPAAPDHPSKLAKGFAEMSDPVDRKHRGRGGRD